MNWDGPLVWKIKPLPTTYQSEYECWIPWTINLTSIKKAYYITSARVGYLQPMGCMFQPSASDINQQDLDFPSQLHKNEKQGKIME